MTTPRVLGLDFGTTNSVAALPTADGASRTIAFAHAGARIEACRSVLCFWRDEAGPRPTSGLEVGPWAIDRHVELEGDCRFIQSFKTFAASPHFTSTAIHNKAWRFEDLMSAFLRRLASHADAPLPKDVVVGRPVRFAGAGADEALARRRYDAALKQAGFESALHVHEPVAAAFFFARRLERDATILVADFGGGTSDFSILRFERRGDATHARALAHDGVGVAGDDFDRRIIDNVVSPLFGKGGDYASDGKVLPIPATYFSRLAQWNQLSIMRHTRDYADLVKLTRHALSPERIEAFVAFLDAEGGQALHRAIADVKTTLSRGDAARFALSFDGRTLEADVTRADFETWITPDLDRIDACVGDALRAAGLTETGIDRVFMTGGTSFVPALRRRFEARFGRERIETGDQFVSIAHGLALVAALDDPSPWLATAA